MAARLTAAMLIRFCYAPDDPARAWRFDWFRSWVLPRILHQQDASFDLWLWVNPAHRAEVEAMDPRIRTFTVATRQHPLESRIPWSAVRELPRYPVQVRLDSDDLIGPRYVATALARLARMPQARALAYFQPWKFDVATGQVLASYRTYEHVRPSAFLALRQPVTLPTYDWVYGRGHTSMHRLADAAKGIGFGHCWMSCHTFNDTTALHRRDTPLADLAAQPAVWW